jgi:peptidoglycan/xylan/chitin deacetylase (PgdA/CDA1 family)
MNGASVPILTYHEVSPRPHRSFRRYSVTPSQFARQMRWLALAGYESIDMDALFGARLGQGGLPKRPVVITFDDGFQGCVEHAVPVLRAHGFTAVFFLVAGLMGQTSRWMLPDPGVELALMSWATARWLVAEGFQCGAHTMTHPRLPALEAGRLRAELEDGRSRLEQELSRPVLHLAYPYGAYDPTVRELVAEAGYTTACSTRAGLSPADDDLLAIHRITIHGHDSLLDFASLLRTGAGVRERLARALGRKGE